jgi:hypothetical protein
MARNRVIYQTEALYVADTGDSQTADQIKRVQSANYSFDISRQDVNQYGQLARIDSIILDPPTVSLDFNYYVTDGTNEEALGFTVTEPAATQINFLSGLIADQTNPQEKNYFIATAPAGNDAVGFASPATRTFIGIGNGVVASYSVDASVGDLPTASMTVEASNMAMKSGTAPLVTINKADGTIAQTVATTIPTGVSGAGASALRPGDVIVTITGGVGVNLDSNNFKATSASVSFDLAREDINKLGSKFAFAKEIDFPVTCTFTCDGIVADVDSTTLSGLNQVVADDTTTYDLSMQINGPAGFSGIKYTLKGAKLDSQSFSSSIGDNKTSSFTFSAQLGGPQDTGNGLFVNRVAAS